MVFAAVAGKDDKIYVFGGAAGMSDDRNTPILNTVEVYSMIPRPISRLLGNQCPLHASTM